MKTQQILIAVIVAFIVGTLRTDAQTATVIEKRIGDTVYELDTMNYTLKNKANKITPREYLGDCRVSLDDSENAERTWKANFKPVFSKEKAKELNMRIYINSVCDSTGLIKEVEINFRNRENFEMFTLSEIKAIEDAAKTYRYRFRAWSQCEGQKYVHIHHYIVPYLLYFEKPK